MLICRRLLIVMMAHNWRDCECLISGAMEIVRAVESSMLMAGACLLAGCLLYEKTKMTD